MDKIDIYRQKVIKCGAGNTLQKEFRVKVA